LLVHKELPDTSVPGSDIGEEFLQAFDPRSVKVVMPSSLPSWRWIISPWSMLSELLATCWMSSMFSPISVAT
jgi:hypothetical protein